MHNVLLVLINGSSSINPHKCHFGAHVTLEVMAIKVYYIFFLSFPGDVSVPTNVIIVIGVGSAVLSMAGLLVVTCVYIRKRRKKNGYNTTGMLIYVMP